MKKVAILYIALGRYIVFWKDFYESCEKFLGACEKHYFVWTDNKTFDFSENKNVTVIPAVKKGWPFDTLLRFDMFLQKADELKQFDYIYFFNANMQFIAPTDLSEIAPRDWHNGLVAGIHPGRDGDIDATDPDKFRYERRPESTAYIPFGGGKYYVCGAFNGGTSEAYLKMCKTLSQNIQTDLEKNIIACVDDESHLNAYMADKEFLVAGRAYGFPEAQLRKLNHTALPMVKIISRHKEHPKYGGNRWLRGQTDKKAPNNWATIHLLIPACKIISVFIPIRKYRRAVKNYFGSC